MDKKFQKNNKKYITPYANKITFKIIMLLLMYGNSKKKFQKFRIYIILRI
jgi:hypothetical protein